MTLEDYELLKKKQYMLTRNEKKELIRLLLLQERKEIPDKLKDIWKPYRYKFMFGGRGGAKSHSIAKVLLYLANEKSLKILCTRQIQNSIKDSVKSLLEELINDLDYENYEIKDTEIINIRTGSKFIFKGLWNQDKKQSIKSLNGINIAWVEEAQSITMESLNMLTPTIREEGSEIWFSYNRNTINDAVHEFKEMQDKNKILDIHINYQDNPWCPKVLTDEAEQCLIKNYKLFKHIWLGYPKQQGDFAIFEIDEVIKSCINESITDEGLEQVGIDVARGGGDKSVFSIRKGNVLKDIKSFDFNDLTKLATAYENFVNHKKDIITNIDSTGVGAGLVDILRERGYTKIYAINFAEKAKENDKYNNIVTEAWFNLKEMLPNIQLINNKYLIEELTTREYLYDNKNRYKLESKDVVKKRIGRSCDYADSIILCFYNKNIRVSKFEATPIDDVYDYQF